MSDLLARITGGELAPVYVLYGDEPEPVRRVVAALRTRILVSGFEAFDHEILDGREIDDVAPVLRACAQLPFAASHRLVELGDPELIGAAEALDPLVDYVKVPSPKTVLVIRSGGLDGRSRLVTAAKKSGVALKFAAIARDGDAVAFVADTARERGLTLPREVAAAIVAAVGTGQSQLVDALERAALHAGGSDVGLADVEAVVAHTRAAVIFELTDAVGLGQASKALGVLGRIFAEDPRAAVGQANQTLAMLIRQFRLIFTAKVAPRDLAAVAQVPPFLVRKLQDQARRFDEERLRRIYAMLVRLDADLKGGATSVVRAPEVALERFVLEACAGLPGADPRL